MTLKKLILVVFIPLCALFTLIQIAVNTVSAAGVGAIFLGGYSIFLVVMGFIQALLFLGVSAMLYFCLYEKEDPKIILWGSLGFTAFCYIMLILYFIGGSVGDGVVSIFGFIIGLILSGYGFGLMKDLQFERYFAKMRGQCCCKEEGEEAIHADAEMSEMEEEP